MTLIVGIEQDGIAYIGGESGAISGDVRQRIRVPKVFRNGPYIMGYSYSFRFGDVMRYMFDPPAPPPLPETPDPDILDRFMVREFAPAVMKAQEDHKAKCKDDKGQEEWGIMLIAVQGRLYEFERSAQIIPTGEAYHATGSAYQIALGALYATQEAEELSPQDRLCLALEAGIHHHGDTLAPYLILGTDGSEMESYFPLAIVHAAAKGGRRG